MLTSLVNRFYDDLWNRWDDEVVDSLLAADFRFRGSLGEETIGRDGWRRYRDRVRAGASDFHNQIEELIVEGNRAAARLTYSGTHTGELLGVAATHRSFVYPGAAFFSSDGAQLTAAWILGDVDGLRIQLAG